MIDNNLNVGNRALVVHAGLLLRSGIFNVSARGLARHTKRFKDGDAT